MPERLALDPAALSLPPGLTVVDPIDLAITIAVADAGALIRFGAVPRPVIWPEWDQGDTPGEDRRDSAHFAEDLLAAAELRPLRLTEAISTLAPSNWIYRKLQATYEDARRAVIAYTGLPNIPDPDEYGVGRPGEAYPYAPSIAAHLVDRGYLTLAEEEIPLLSTMTPELVSALTRFQDDFGLDTDGIFGPASWQVLNENAASRFRSITLNLHRARLLPADFGDRYLIVNLPSAELHAFEKGDRHVLSMRVVHGKAAKDSQHTPVFRDVMQEIVFGPFWNVPKSIAVKEILPKAEGDWGFLSRNRYEIVSNFDPSNAQTHRLSPDNLAAVAEGRLFFRQLPGPTNALGRIKFLLPNRHNVYLHDTPAKAYFARSKRDHSHGCVRVSNPNELGAWILGPQEWTQEQVKEAMFADERKSVAVKHRVNVYIVYFTTFPRPKKDGGYVLAPARDVYALDAADARTLSGVVPWEE